MLVNTGLPGGWLARRGGGGPLEPRGGGRSVPAMHDSLESKTNFCQHQRMLVS